MLERGNKKEEKNMANEICKEFLKNFRRECGAKPTEKIDKRYRQSSGWLAPNDKYYQAHCGYCAEVKYLSDIYRDT